MSGRLIHLLTFLLFASGLQAQLFPVDVFFSAQMNFPANVQALGQEFAGLQLTLRLRDLAAGSADVRLRFTLESRGVSVRSSDDALVTPLTLPSGVPVVLTGADLQAYFLPQHLTIRSGLTREQFVTSGGDLPEGLYTLCVEVVDYRRPDAVLSDLTCTMTSLDLLDPPLITAPYDGEVIPVQDRALLTPFPIQWLMNYSMSIFPVDYHLYVYPYQGVVQDFGSASGFQYSQPLFEAVLPSSLLTLNQYVFGLQGEVEGLEAGQRYVLRIQASTADGQAYFRQQGWSEPVVFQYGELPQEEKENPPCLAPHILETATLGDGAYQVRWSALQQVSTYTILLETDGVRVDSFTQADTTLQVYGLDSTLTYVGRIRAVCADGFTVHSEPFYFTSRRRNLPVITFDCGATSPGLRTANTAPLATLKVGDTVMAGDFKVLLTAVSGSGSYSGEGIVLWNFPWRNFTGDQPIQLKIGFTNIRINTDYFLYEGSMEVQGLGLEIIPPELGEFLDEFADLDLVADNYRRGPVLLPIDFTIRQVLTDPGVITITGTTAEGEAITQTYAWDGSDTEILDQTNGQFYVVDEQGVVNTQAGTLAEGGAPTDENTAGVNAEGLPEELTRVGVVFSAGSGVYAFDDVDAQAHANERKLYFSVPVQDTQARYYAAYKAVKKADQDVLGATIVFDSIRADELVFKTRSGRLIPHRGSGRTLTLEVTGLFSSAAETVLACRKVGERYELVGFFRLLHLVGREVNVVPIALGEASVPENLSTALQSIFDPVAVTYRLATPTSLPLPAELLDATGAIPMDASGTFANYGTGLQNLNAYLRRQLGSAYRPEAYYLVFAGAPASNGLAGFMPLARQFGYVFRDGREEHKGAQASTAAHELGHGIFMLEHPFTRYAIPQSATDWLMDYGGGLALPHVHWSQIYDPELRLYLFQEDEEGGRMGEGQVACITPAEAKEMRLGHIFMDGAGNNFELPNGAVPLAFYHAGEKDKSLHGRLARFIYEQKIFNLFFNTKFEFLGYAPKGTPDKLFDSAKFNYTPVSVTGTSVILNIEKKTATVKTTSEAAQEYPNISCQCPHADEDWGKFKGVFAQSGRSLEDRLKSTVDVRRLNYDQDYDKLFSKLSANDFYYNDALITTDLNYFDQWYHDKLRVLFQTTQKAFKVVIHETGYPLEPHQLQSMAQNASAIMQGTALLFIHLHKDQTYSPDNISILTDPLYFPQFYLIDPDGIIEGAVQIQDEFKSYLLDHYRAIRKPYNLVIQKDLPGQNWNTEQFSSAEWVTGYDAIYNYHLWVYKQQEPLIKGNLQGVNIYDQTAAQLFNEATANIRKSEFFQVERIYNLKESCIHEYSAEFANDRSRGEFLTFISGKIPQHCLYENSDLFSAVIYPALDAASYLPVLGIIPDFIGFNIAGYRGEMVRFSGYVSGLVLSFVIGGELIPTQLPSSLTRFLISSSRKAVIDLENAVARDIAAGLRDYCQVSEEQALEFAVRLKNNMDKAERVLSPDAYRYLEDETTRGNFTAALDNLFGEAFDAFLASIRNKLVAHGASAGTTQTLALELKNLLNGKNLDLTYLSDELAELLVRAGDGSTLVLARLKQWDADTWARFLDDLDHEAFRGKFQAELVESWEIIIKSGVDDLIRLNLDFLASVYRSIKEGIDWEDALNDAIQSLGKIKPTWPELQALWKRGNNFNAKGRIEYEYNEIHLADGKILDSYIPGKEIISRKATSLSMIKIGTFEGYLKELTTKYRKGKIIRSNKYMDGPEAIDGQPLEGEYFLEIPSSNRVFYETNDDFKLLAKQYEVQIKYLDE